MLSDFRAYQLAVQFYRQCERVHCAKHLHDQLSRASSSVVLNLAEGSERATLSDQRRFYRIAMGSVRECQAILDLSLQNQPTLEAKKIRDVLAPTIFKLLQSLDRKIGNKPGQGSGIGDPGSEN